MEGRRVLTAFVISNGGNTIAGDTDDSSDFFLDAFSEGGVDHLFQNNLYYRIGATPETGIQDLSISSETISASSVDVTYTDGANFTLRVVTSLSTASQLDQTITVTNLTAAPLDFHLYDYYDWDLNLSPGNDVGVVNTPNSIEQQDSGSGDYIQVGAFPAVDHFEFSGYPGLRNRLSDGVVDILTDTPGLGVPTSTGDWTFAFQWDFNIPAGGAVIGLVATSVNEDASIATTLVTTDIDGNLVITDIEGGDTDDDLTIQADTANSRYIISDATPLRRLATTVPGASGSGSNVIYVPFSAVTGDSILFDTLAGDDSLTIDDSLGDFAQQITYSAGDPTTAPGDELILNLTNAVPPLVLAATSDGSYVDTNTSIDWTSIESLTFNGNVLDLGTLYAEGHLMNSDRIVFFPVSPSQVGLTINGTPYGPFTGITEIESHGNGGNDYIVAAGGIPLPVTFDGGDGNDYVAGGIMNDTLIGGEGNDILLAGEGDNFIDGGDGNDRLEGRTGIDVIFGGDGNDRLNGGDGDDILDGGASNDIIFGGLGNDLLVGGSGEDTINGHVGNDIILGGDDADQLFGNVGNDLLIGGFGSDRLRGDADNDSVIGGTTDLDDDIQTALTTMQASLGTIDLGTAASGVSDWFMGNGRGGFGTLTDDGELDDLSGGTGMDEFFSTADSIRDERMSEGDTSIMP